MISAGYLAQLNRFAAKNIGTVPEFKFNKLSSGATLNLQGNLLTEKHRPLLGLYGALYRGSCITTDSYNPPEAKMSGSSFAAVGLRFYF
jgi:hypothetical protein